MFFKKSSKTPETDRSLLEAYVETGDLNYLGQLYERAIHLVFGVCMKYLKNEEDSRDAVMDIFEELISALKKHEVENFKSWLYVLTKNHCLIKIRKKNKERTALPEIFEDKLVEMQPELYPIEERWETDLEFIEDVMKELKEGQKRCIQLFYLEEKCYREISEITGYDMKKVKSHIQNGRRKLQILVEKRLKL